MQAKRKQQYCTQGIHFQPYISTSPQSPSLILPSKAFHMGQKSCRFFFFLLFSVTAAALLRVTGPTAAVCNTRGGFSFFSVDFGLVLHTQQRRASQWQMWSCTGGYYFCCGDTHFLYHVKNWSCGCFTRPSKSRNCIRRRLRWGALNIL